jgi:hypothetical protein
MSVIATNEPSGFFHLHERMQLRRSVASSPSIRTARLALSLYAAIGHARGDSRLKMTITVFVVRDQTTRVLKQYYMLLALYNKGTGGSRHGKKLSVKYTRSDAEDVDQRREVR